MGNNKYKILIVEDEANIRSFIRANLETSDYPAEAPGPGRSEDQA